jgi:hypothetical protein
MQEKDCGGICLKGLKKVTPKFFSISGHFQRFKSKISQIHWTLTFRHIHIVGDKMLHQTCLPFYYTVLIHYIYTVSVRVMKA